MITLREIKRETYGNNFRSINKHSEHWYRDENGKFYILSRTLDGISPFFDSYGPFEEDHEGQIPRLRVQGDVYWGDNWSWPQAEKAFCKELQAIITPRK